MKAIKLILKSTNDYSSVKALVSQPTNHLSSNQRVNYYGQFFTVIEALFSFFFVRHIKINNFKQITIQHSIQSTQNAMKENYTINPGSIF